MQKDTADTLIDLGKTKQKKRLFSSEEKIIIVMKSQRGENYVTEICFKRDVSQATF